MIDLNAIILAAGKGERLRPLTNDRPKCLVTLFGKSILERQIETFQNLGITDITIVSGYKSELIKFPDLCILENKKFDSTNMVESLFCAKEKFTKSTIISYGDIIYEKRVLELLIDSSDDISVIIDKNWRSLWEKRFKNPFTDAESLELDVNNYITNIGQKVSSIDDIQGQYIGLMKFQNNGIQFLKSFYEKAKEQAKLGLNPLNPQVKFQQSYMTDLLQGMINEGCKMKAVFIENGWLELDSIDDYEMYHKKFEDKTLSNFFSLN